MWLKTEGACEGGYTLQRRLSAALAFTRFPSQFRRVWLLAPVAGSSGQLNQSEDASQQAALPPFAQARIQQRWFSLSHPIRRRSLPRVTSETLPGERQGRKCAKRSLRTRQPSELPGDELYIHMWGD